MDASLQFHEMLHERLALAVEMALRTIPQEVIKKGFLADRSVPQAKVVGEYDAEDVGRYHQVIADRIGEWLTDAILSAFSDNGEYPLELVVQAEAYRLAEEFLPDDLVN